MYSKLKSISIIIIRIILIVVILLCSTFLAYRFYDDWKQKKIAQEARDLYTQTEPTATPTSTPATTPTEIPEPEPTPKVIQPEFAALIEKYQNDDIIGYLKIDETSVDYPVVQSSDNAFYLNHDIMKNNSMPGWIFMDYENDILKEDKNIILYGHNMNNDTMFHSLRNYQDKDYFQKHRYITFNTLYDNYTWEVFSFYKTDTSFYYIQAIFPTIEEFYKLARQMKEKSVYETGVDITLEDRILTLSTCSNAEEDTRFVVNAKLVNIQHPDSATDPDPTATFPAK